MFYFLNMLFICFLIVSRHAYAYDVNFFYKRFTQYQTTILAKKDTLQSHYFDTKSQCHQFYSPILNKDKLRIDYYAGYADNFRDLIRDPIEVDALRAFLLRPCTSDYLDQTCGFSIQPKQPYLLFKRMQPSHSKFKLIEIQLKDSALTTSDEKNRSSKEQNLKSENTRQEFIKSVSNADVLIYSGHSRFGGGPDFYPEKFLANGNEDPAGYRSEKKGLNDILKGLDLRSKEKGFLIFLGSCDSKKHFEKTILSHVKAPNHVLLAKNEIVENEFHYQLLNFLNLILNQSCPENLKNYFGSFEMN